MGIAMKKAACIVVALLIGVLIIPIGQALCFERVVLMEEYTSST